MRRVLPYPFLSLTVAVTWLIVAGEISPLAVVAGAILGWLIPFACRPFFEQPHRLHAPGVAARLAGVVVWDIILSNIAVARIILGRMSRPSPAFVIVPLDTDHPYAVNLLASIITMTPGTVSAVVDAEHRRLVVHALDCPDPAALARDIKSRYEQPLRRIFQC